ncbi:MAG: T9SS type A sorting domain-containing protein [bacterium]|nr:T9SS type A sorting domain-containing protein [bacterium]
MMTRFWWLGLLLVAVVAFASTETAVIPAHGNNLRMPVGTDSPQPDSVYYDNGSPGLLTTTANYWSGTRFSVATSFMLKSAYLAMLNAGSGGGTNTTAPCSVFVYTDTLIGTAHRPNQAVPGMWFRIDPPVPDLVWVDTDFPDSVQFAAGSSFWVIYGPAPGGAYSGSGWWNIMDGNGNTDNRSIVKTSGRTDWSTGMSAAGGDLILRVGGRYVGDLTDARVDSVYASRANGDRRFFHPYGASVGFSATIRNNGFDPIQNFPVRFTLIDTVSRDTLFTETVSVTTSLVRGASATVSTTNRWTTPSRVVHAALTVRSMLALDDDPGNDAMMLEQKVNSLNTWYKYDDEDPNSSVNFSSGERIGVMLIPSRYPARLDSMSFIIAGTTVARLDTVEAYLMPDLATFSGTPDWQGTINVIGSTATQYKASTGGLNIFQGGVLCVLKTVTGHTVYRDATPPLAGVNLSMPAVTWQTATAGMEPDESGDWNIRGYIAHTTDLPPHPILRTEPVVGDTLQFDTTAVNTPINRTFKVYNDGGVALNVSRIWVTTAQRPYITFVNNDTAFSVAAMDSHFVTVRWNPANPGTLNTLMQMTTNTTPATVNYRVRGFASATAAPEPTIVPSEYSLAQNFPNPFNPSTEISFALPRAAKVKLTVMDVMGREVATLANGNFSAGSHRVTFDGSNLSSGVYFYRIEAGSFQAMHKMMLIK